MPDLLPSSSRGAQNLTPNQDPRRTLEQLAVTEVQFIQVDYLADRHLNEQWRASLTSEAGYCGVRRWGTDTWTMMWLKHG